VQCRTWLRLASHLAHRHFPHPLSTAHRAQTVRNLTLSG
jgi:hypothetical protein